MPDLPTDPAELADQVMWLNGHRVQGPINAYVTRQIADAHPYADHIHDAEHDAYAAYNRAEQARTQLDEAMYAELRPYGRAAHTRDATSRLAAVTDELAAVERNLSTATTRVGALASEPSIRTIPDGALDGEHDRWTADRVARKEAASREAQRWQSRREKGRRIEPPAPSRSTPDRGWGIGR